ncbi:PepSY-associated TM helix domain-containing protein [Altericroceibacterium endophyticum]|uniref:PepSY domain-containing protein n=1 Tax=Altericroceibacterium endophyticum TaxID=1808508 RepID=A0A6I4T6W1_9SPHN|nr:PepSY domain-containing protein [Altericroceibacterium endophyticum]MXO66398.1 PepSY domain-containing protein [Altericroceibacterium endophyticum]
MAGPALSAPPLRKERWYQIVWRWHFYAGLFTIPFVLWLSATGAIYLFRPQIENMLDRPYEKVASGPDRLQPSEIAAKAQAAVPGSVLHHYILPASPTQAHQIVVGQGAEETRVYVNPANGEVLKQIGEQDRFMRVIFHLHGELLAGRFGSMLIELAACWTIIMLITGLFLWWPRGARRLAGTLYPRLRKGRRIFWRDIHAVTGIWISVGALLLIMSGLPWAQNWGSYFREIRTLTGTASVKQDWSSGSESDARERAQLDRQLRQKPHSAGAAASGGIHAEHNMAPAAASFTLKPLDRLIPAAHDLALPAPVQITPPKDGGNRWRIVSNTYNRPERVTVEIDGGTGAIIGTEPFSSRHWIDQTVGYGVALHEGAFFGLLNQLINLAILIGLMLLSVSGVIMWWRRRPEEGLGAPPATGHVPHVWALVGATLALAFLMPLFGISLALVTLFESITVKRSRRAARFLGLRGTKQSG